jgi:hypothetical protein
MERVANVAAFFLPKSCGYTVGTKLRLLIELDS